jgi:hypothetical protein
LGICLKERRLVMDRVQLLKRLEVSWEALKASYAGLSQSEMTKPGVIGAWSVKEIIAHVTSWEEEALKHLPLIVADKRPPLYSATYGGIDAFNAQTIERKKRLSLSEVLRQRDKTHSRLLDFIQTVPEAHFEQHADRISKWRKKRF